MILDEIWSISRLKADVDNTNKESYVSNLALQSVKANRQPASPEQVAIVDGVFAQTYIGFTTNSGLKTGDKVTVSGTDEVLRIKGVENWSLTDLIPHYEITLVEFEEEEV